MKRILLTITALIAVISASAAQPTSAALSPISAPNASDDVSESIWEFWWGAGCNVATNYMWRGYDQSYPKSNMQKWMLRYRSAKWKAGENVYSPYPIQKT